MTGEGGDHAVAIQVQELDLPTGGPRGQGRAVRSKGHRRNAAVSSQVGVPVCLQIPQLHSTC